VRVVECQPTVITIAGGFAAVTISVTTGSSGCAS
jgi:hypothetical protein